VSRSSTFLREYWRFSIRTKCIDISARDAGVTQTRLASDGARAPKPTQRWLVDDSPHDRRCCGGHHRALWHVSCRHNQGSCVCVCVCECVSVSVRAALSLSLSLAVSRASQTHIQAYRPALVVGVGGVGSSGGGVLAATAAAPSRGLLATTAQLVQQRGLMGLFRGFNAMVAGAAPAHAVYFAGYEMWKKQLVGRDATGHHPVATAAAGAMATVRSRALSLSLSLSHGSENVVGVVVVVVIVIVVIVCR